MDDANAEIAVSREKFAESFALYHGSDTAVPDSIVLGDQEWDDLDSELIIEGRSPAMMRGMDHYVRESTPGPRGGLTHAWVRRGP